MRKRRSHCKRCGRPDREVGRMSVTGLCSDCSEQAVLDNVQAMLAKTGPAFERYQQRQLEGTRGYLRKLEARLDQEWRAREQANTHRAD